ncbi:HAD family hydrolase [Mucisphaera sp.]|uniref:HAD family hydrolase n=1 Tax=Mucisphaera sp. TaxID=2913024 RepID=UPI003D14048E
MKDSTIQGVIFDFDGVIADSEVAHYRAMLEAVADRGISFDEAHYRKRYIGFDDREAFAAILSDFGQASQAVDPATIRLLMAAKQSAFDRIVADGIPLVPGALELARALQAEEIPIAIASGATHADIQGVLTSHNATDLFQIVVAADDVQRSKPDPETYRLAADLLAHAHPQHLLSPKRLLAIEDTPAGLRSAKEAGLRRLGLTTNQPASDLGEAEHILPHLEGIDPDWIRTTFKSQL